MRRYYIFALMFLSSSIYGDSFAQSRFGITIGLTRSTLSNDWDLVSTPLLYSRKTGVTGGIFADWPISNSTVLSTQAEYSRKGFVDEVVILDGPDLPPPNSFVSDDIVSDLDYLCLAGLFKYKVRNSNTSLYFLGGASLDILVRRQPGVIYANGAAISNKVAASIKSVSPAAIVGIGLFAGEKNAIELRFSRDLIDSSRLQNQIMRNSLDVVFQRAF